MALLTWTSKYSVGVKALDEQHTAFMGLLNELHAAMMKGEANAVAGPLLNRLIGLVRQHFSSEEALFQSTKYPEAVRHSALHQDLNRQIEQYMARFKQGDRALYLELLRFLRDWLSQHMLEEDQKYTEWLHEHGVR